MRNNSRPTRKATYGNSWRAGWLAFVPFAAAAGAANGQQAPQPAGPAPAADIRGLWAQNALFDNAGGVRDWLTGNGITLTLAVANESFRATSGGYEMTTHLQNAAIVTLGIDTEAAFGWPGGRLYASGFAISGYGITIDGVGSFATVSSLEAEHSVRLFDLWYEQSFFAGRASLRFGQLAADEEFMMSSQAEVFLNGTFGWPTLASIDLPASGPNYPLATPGVRLKLVPAPNLILLGAVYNGNPSPEGFGDPQQSNRFGTNFRLDGGAFAMVEAQYGIDLGTPGRALPGSYKIGAWLNTNRFFDQHRDANGLSLADINSTGVPALHQNDWGFYASLDQVLWRPEGDGTKENERGLTGVLRVFTAPEDRNQVSLEIDGSLAWKGLLPSRPDDTIGLGFGWFKVSPAARALDTEIVALGLARPVRSAEGLIEAAYQAQIAPWWQVEPDLQYVIRPGGGIPGGDSSSSLSKPLRNSLIIGIRSILKF